MKTIKLLFASAILLFSCSDMLEEEAVGIPTADLYNTEAGVEQLINAAYNTLRWQFNGEQSFTLWNYGVDEYVQAADGQNKFVDGYTDQLNSSFGMFHDMWAAYYDGINRCNLALELIPTTVGEGGGLSTDAGKAARIGEIRFLRGFYYFILVQQFGGIPITLEATKGVKLEYPKSSVADVYDVIISDMRAAEATVPETQGNRGRITLGAVRHFLAKVYLTRGSAVTEQRGQKPIDMDSAAYYADLVINSGRYSLAPDFADLWRIQNESGLYNSEFILGVQFNNNALLLNNSGNRVHLYFQMTYDVKPGMLRDIANGRPFRRLRPTLYTINNSDRKNDSRFYKNFRLGYICNNAANIPKWSQAEADDGYVAPSEVGKPKFALGDTAFFVTMDPVLTDAEIASKKYLIIPQNKWSNSDFPTLLKHLDPTRLDVGTEFAARDGIIARLGETYLIGAEAYGRKGDYAKATEYINELRERAAYKDGEAKPTTFWLSEGGSYGDTNSTLTDVLITETYWDTDQPLEQYPPSATTKESRFIHFILNERTRELLGELHRWNDLVRTETFEERIKQFHPIAVSTVKATNKLRPIPQAHLDAIYTAGRPLTAEEKAAYQNPGY